jgi:hypothetical protein
VAVVAFSLGVSSETVILYPVVLDSILVIGVVDEEMKNYTGRCPETLEIGNLTRPKRVTLSRDYHSIETYRSQSRVQP